MTATPGMSPRRLAERRKGSGSPGKCALQAPPSPPRFAPALVVVAASFTCARRRSAKSHIGRRVKQAPRSPRRASPFLISFLICGSRHPVGHVAFGVNVTLSPANLACKLQRCGSPTLRKQVAAHRTPLLEGAHRAQVVARRQQHGAVLARVAAPTASGP